MSLSIIRPGGSLIYRGREQPMRGRTLGACEPQSQVLIWCARFRTTATLFLTASRKILGSIEKSLKVVVLNIKLAIGIWFAGLTKPVHDRTVAWHLAIHLDVTGGRFGCVGYGCKVLRNTMCIACISRKLLHTPYATYYGRILSFLKNWTVLCRRMVDKTVNEGDCAHRSWEKNHEIIINYEI